jgi:fimbrial isopeptide formation D2 family protein/uncharacterized repeat protein (TIGR01451 family)
VRFRNAAGAAAGYGPFIDLVLDAGGANMTKPSCPCDGITFVQANMISVNGGPVPLVAHPPTPGPCTPSTAPLNHPFTGILPVVAPIGSQLTTIELPFGSFDATQPEIVVEVTAHLSNLADVSGPLKISARGGFRYGTDPLDNAPPDWPVVSDLVAGTPPADQQTNSTLWAAQAQTTPTVLTVSKKYLGPEDETTTGPNFPRRYQITVDVATGQTIHNVKVTDHLPNNMAFSALGTLPACFNVVAAPVAGAAHNSPNNDLVFQCSSITGVAGTDAVIVIELFIPQFDGNGQSVLSPTSCAPVLSINDVRAEGDWTPIDPCDTSPVHAVSDVTIADHTLADKCLAIQKAVADLNGSAPAHPIPGDTLQYSLAFELSDFKTAGKLKIRDVLSDGQTVLAGSFILQVTDECGITAGTIPASAITVNTLACARGGLSPRTELIIDVSAAMATLGNATRHVAGVWTGGYALGAATTVAATGSVVFRTTISDSYQCPVLSSVQLPHDQFVDKDDPLDNTVTMTADILTNGGSCNTIPAAAGFTALDDSSVAFLIATDFLSKSVYSITRGSAQICGPASATCPAKPQVFPGDLVTFRLTKTIPSSDAENITIQDWLPLPTFLVAGTTFSNSVCGIPAVGASCLGPANTLNVAPAYSGSGLANSFTFTYPTFNDPANQAHTIDLLFTRVVTNTPFADGLYITNQAQERESNTFGTIFSQSAIAQVQVREPALKITKGIVATSNPNAVFSPSPVGPVSFSAPGTSCPRFSGAITSAALASTPINSDVSNVDANDCVTFAIVVENTGGSAAYDVNLREIFPPSPFGASECFSPDFSTLCARDGTGAPLPIATGIGRGLPIKLQNPLPASNASGSNIAVITFDACILGDIKPGCCDNTAQVENYASTPGGANFVDAGFGGPFSDAARICVIPKGTKSIVATSEGHTTGTQVAIGEIIRYRLTVVVPETTSGNTYVLQDLLPAGLNYLDNLTVAPLPAGVTATNFPPLVTSAATCTGGAVTFNFGNVTNTNNNNAQETITLDFNALVCNVASNQTATVLNNSFNLIVNGQQVAASNSVQTTVVEPNLTVVKTGMRFPTGSGAVGAYTITITNNGTATAFDVHLTDQLPACLANIANLQTSVPVTNASTASTLDLTIASIPLGGVVTVQYSATFICFDCTKLANTAHITWTSLPGPFGTTSNPTTSVTPGASGLSNGERYGSGGVNDYAASSLATLCCLTISDEVFHCSGGVYTYTFTVTNTTGTTGLPDDIGGILFSSTTPNVTITPASISTPLPAGGSTTVTLTISGPGAVPGANVCFTASPYTASVICQLNRCLTLPGCCVAPPPGMVAWYPLNEIQGATAVNDIAPAPASTANNVGTPQPAAIGAASAPFSAPGEVYGSLFFGGGYVEVPSQSDLNFGGGSFSIDAWMRPVVCNPTLPATIADKFDAGSSSGFIFYAEQPIAGSSMLKLRLNGAVFTSSGAFAFSPWTHVAVTFDLSGQNGTFYINGSPAGTFTAPAGPITNAVSMWIGRTRVSTNLCELGIDELEIFNRALTPAEVKSIYDAGSVGKCVPRRRRAVFH